MKYATLATLVLLPIYLASQSNISSFVSLQFNTGSNVISPSIQLSQYENLLSRRSDIKAEAPSLSPRAHQFGFKLETGIRIEKLNLLLYTGVGFDQRFQSTYDISERCGLTFCLENWDRFEDGEFEFLQIPIGFQYQPKSQSTFFPLIGAEFFHYLGLNAKTFEGLACQLRLGAGARITSAIQVQLFSLYQSSIHTYKSKHTYKFHEWRIGLGLTSFF